MERAQGMLRSCKGLEAVAYAKSRSIHRNCYGDGSQWLLCNSNDLVLAAYDSQVK